MRRLDLDLPLRRIRAVRLGGYSESGLLQLHGIMWLLMPCFEFDCNLLLGDLKLESLSVRCMWRWGEEEDEKKGRRE